MCLEHRTGACSLPVSNAQVGTDMHDVGFDERQVGADMDDVGLGEREVGADAHDT